MSIQYVALDVETPNRMNDRICSIGISVIDDEQGVKTKKYLINPECPFDRFNTDLTGITPEMVSNAPTFPNVWTEIEPLLLEHTLVAHNALFDLSVLRKTLQSYNLPTPVLSYLCTMKLAQKYIPYLDNYRLSTLCSFFGIPLVSHDAGSDCEACARVLGELQKMGAYLDSYIDCYNCGASVCSEGNENRRKRMLSKSTNSLNELNSILKEIAYDGVLTEREISFLTDWMEANSFLKGNFPYDRIYYKLVEVLEDGVVSQQEKEELLQLFKSADDPVETASFECGFLEVMGKQVCLSGEFDYGDKDIVSSYLIQKGAIMQRTVTQKTNILVVGGQGSSAWSAGNYGTKIKKALELQAKGFSIMIIREADFFKSIKE